jgi:hypothetical protein
MRWNQPATPRYVDTATKILIEHPALEKQTISEAITRAIKDMGNNPDTAANFATIPNLHTTVKNLESLAPPKTQTQH